MRWCTCAIFMLAACIVALATPALAQSKPEAKDMALVGSNDLQARSAYQPTIHHQGDRTIAYIGHHGGTDDQDVDVLWLHGVLQVELPPSGCSRCHVMACA